MVGEADADARARVHRPAVDVELELERTEDPARDVGCLRRVLDPVEQDRELVTAEARHRVGGPHGGLEPPPDFLEHGVAGCMPEAVVDGLEVVEVDEHDRDRRSSALRAQDRVTDTVGEERAVREVRDRIVEGLMRELVLECLSLADVAAVQHDAADVLVLQEVRVLHLELEPRAVAVQQRTLDDMGLRAAADVGLADAGQDLLQALSIGCAEQTGELGPLDVVRAIPEDALDGRALVRDDAVGVEHRDEVARVGHERPEPSFALAPVEVLGERCSFHGQRDLGSERLERIDELARGRGRGADDEQSARLVANRQGKEQHRHGVGQAELVLHDLGQRRARNLLARRRTSAQPAFGLPRDRPGSVPLRRRGDVGAAAAQEDQPDVHRRSHQRLDGGDRGFVHALAPGCGDEVDPGASERELARRRSLLLAHEARHAADDEEEEECRCGDQDELVRIAPRLPGPDARRDEARARKEPEAKRREPCSWIERRLLQGAHRGVERGSAPEEVVDDPADVVAELVVVRVREQCVRVGRVHGEERDDAPDQEVEGRGAHAHVDREANRGREEQDVPERVRGRDQLLERREPREVDVRGDEEDPRDERDAHREDERVDDAGAVALRVPASDEDEEPGHEGRIYREVDPVAERRKLDVDAEELRVAVRVQVAREEEELADDEEQPGGARTRAVQVDADRDRDGGGEAQHVDQRAARLERRQPKVRGREQPAGREIDQPGASAPVDGRQAAHAA